MSVKVMSWVWESSHSTGIDRLVLLAIADYAHDDGCDAYPSIRTLAKKTRVGDRTVQRAIRELVALGELSLLPNAGRGGANMYRVHMDIHTPVNVTPPSTVRGVNESPRGVNESKKGCQPDTQTVIEPLRTVSARPKEFCKKHPNGTDENCRDCTRCYARAKAWDEAKAAERSIARASAKATRLACPDCDENGHLVDADLKPTARCNHRGVA